MAVHSKIMTMLGRWEYGRTRDRKSHSSEGDDGFLSAKEDGFYRLENSSGPQQRERSPPPQEGASER